MSGLGTTRCVPQLEELCGQSFSVTCTARVEWPHRFHDVQILFTRVFIGFHLSRRLLEQGTPVVGYDNVNPYYDPSLKRARIAQLEATASSTGTSFQLIEADLEDRNAVEAAFAKHKPQKVVNLAAQAGVRYSIANPAAYI